ncbi:transcription factor UPBEAT1 [Mercurialis annua]|uniref:transcription factor UPBEAT1 n=1 Tax=Mercurialis annua TaxID=3986 RepID=UPI002160817C|nr:transcription factor UPBEAT1 [Mercurialis annua]
MGISTNNPDLLISLKQQILESQTKKNVIPNRNGGYVMMKSKRIRRALMKNRAGLRGRSRSRTANGFQKKVKTLKKLIPNCQSVEVEGLFRETADYILSLQMRVNLMQKMVEVLSSSGSDSQ